MSHLIEISEFILNAFLHLWPYLLVTIPLAVAARMSGASKYISRAFQAKPVIAILLATAIGAFSPFCSCGIIPIITAMLLGGVPLAPVMSFWIASPSMDPEIFFLSVASVGWELAIWRLASTLLISLSAGFLTYYLEKQGLLGKGFLKTERSSIVYDLWASLKSGWNTLVHRATALTQSGFMNSSTTLSPAPVCCVETNVTSTERDSQLMFSTSAVPVRGVETDNHVHNSTAQGCGVCNEEATSFWKRLLNETWDATTMVLKFMLLAFFIEALIELYFPMELISYLLGHQNPWSIFLAALLGVPAYTSNLAALPLVGGLMTQGMNPGAGLAFLIAGPTTTLPAMAAVWGIVSRRVFILYVAYSLIGAILLGYAFAIIAG
ncbi:MAG: hypothetical protein GTO18_06745 [Anaerolineales bacterium]|nr:hypothetical protein [Anaerolineales bacterium]